MIKDNGTWKVSEVNEMNIPVNSFLHAPGEDEEWPKSWVWKADNYMPRKGYINQGVFELIADTREEIMEMVSQYVIPRYQMAIDEMKKNGGCYYWEFTDGEG